jgi:hypothetical protein
VSLPRTETPWDDDAEREYAAALEAELTTPPELETSQETNRRAVVHMLADRPALAGLAQVGVLIANHAREGA